MAIVARYLASVQVWDSAGKKGSLTLRVGAADAKAYVAAADQAARDATDVGLLLTHALNVTLAKATEHYAKYSLVSDFVNDAAVQYGAQADVYNSNDLKVTYSTTNAGLPAIESIYVPMRRTDYMMESDGVHVSLNEADDIQTFCEDMVATGLSSFNTAITAVLSITVGDI